MKISTIGLVINNNCKKATTTNNLHKNDSVKNNTELLNYTTNQYLINFNGNTNDEIKLNRAIIGGHTQIIEKLATSSDISQEWLDKQTCTAALIAPEVIPSLQKFENFNINSTDKIGQTLLMLLMSKGYKNDVIIPIINNEETNINAVDDEGNTALMHACNCDWNRVDNIIALFERKDLDFRARNFQNHSAIQIAKKRGRLDLVRFMYKKEKEIIQQEINASNDEEQIHKLNEDLRQLSLDTNCFCFV